MGTTPAPFINGAYYAYGDIEMNVGPGIIKGAKSINYGHKLARNEVRGTDREPLGFTSGQYAVTGDIELYLPQADALMGLLGDGYMQKTLPAITVSYGGDPETAPLGIITDVLQAVRIEEVAANQSEGLDALVRKFTLRYQRLLLNGRLAVNIPLPGAGFLIG